MKKLFSLACAVMIMAQLSSCSKKDSNTATPNNNNGNNTPTGTSPSAITGRWQTVGIYADRPVPEGDTTVQDLLSGVPSCEHLYLIFNTDYSAHTTDVDCNGDSSLTELGKWQLSGNELDLTDSGNVTKLTVLKLTTDSLQFSGSDYTLDKNNDTVRFNEIWTLKK